MTQDIPDFQTLWTAEKTAKFLSCSVPHVLRLAILGEIPAIDLAPPGSKQRMWRFHQDSIMKWMHQREQPGRPRRSSLLRFKTEEP